MAPVPSFLIRLFPWSQKAIVTAGNSMCFGNIRLQKKLHLLYKLRVDVLLTDSTLPAVLDSLLGQIFGVAHLPPIAVSDSRAPHQMR